MDTNTSNNSMDHRSILKIIFEKAQFGAVPKFFTLQGDPRNHPVAWTEHPHLKTISFSDGSEIQVEAAKVSQEMYLHVGPIPPSGEELLGAMVPERIIRYNDARRTLEAEEHHRRIREAGAKLSTLDGNEIDETPESEQALADLGEMAVAEASLGSADGAPTPPFMKVSERIDDFVARTRDGAFVYLPDDQPVRSVAMDMAERNASIRSESLLRPATAPPEGVFDKEPPRPELDESKRSGSDLAVGMYGKPKGFA